MSLAEIIWEISPGVTKFTVAPNGTDLSAADVLCRYVEVPTPPYGVAQD